MKGEGKERGRGGAAAGPPDGSVSIRQACLPTLPPCDPRCPPNLHHPTPLPTPPPTQLACPPGTLFAPSTPKRRRLLSASGAASNQSTSFDFSFSWSNLPPGQTSFSSDTAYEIDVSSAPAGLGLIRGCSTGGRGSRTSSRVTLRSKACTAACRLGCMGRSTGQRGQPVQRVFFISRYHGMPQILERILTSAISVCPLASLQTLPVPGAGAVIVAYSEAGWGCGWSGTALACSAGGKRGRALAARALTPVSNVRLRASSHPNSATLGMPSPLLGGPAGRTSCTERGRSGSRGAAASVQPCGAASV